MKFAFSTLGCPDWKWGEIVSVAKDLGFDGVEIRGVRDEEYAPDIKDFSAENMPKTLELLHKTGIVPCLVTSACCLHLDKKNLDDAYQYVLLAQRLGAPAVRVMGEVGAEPSEDANDELFIERLRPLCEFAENKGVRILIENNGVYARSERLVSVIEAVGSANLGVIWDIQHSCRNYGESVEHTYGCLKRYLCHVHIKDSVVAGDGHPAYRMLGRGNLPVREFLCLLDANGFDGFVSLEWLKRYNTDLEEPGVVFAHYISTVKGLIKG